MRSAESSKFSRNLKGRGVYCFYTFRRPASGRIAYKCVAHARVSRRDSVSGGGYKSRRREIKALVIRI